jgi:hypothetical protein
LKEAAGAAAGYGAGISAGRDYELLGDRALLPEVLIAAAR